MSELATRARALRASTDRAIVGLFGGNLFELPQVHNIMANVPPQNILAMFAALRG